jgi:aminoglycoside phosphotransferase family enzyme/predicted kinase
MRLEPALAPPDLARLRDAEAHPHDPSARQGIEHVQTHLSHLFLTGQRVYKFRKALDLGFVCFATRAERNADCLREVALNRRLAPDVYLGVAPLEPGARGVRVGSVAEELCGPGEHCVVMRRLPAGRDALSLLEAGALRAVQIERLARRVSVFHEAQGLGAPAPFPPEAWRERVLGPVADNFRLLRDEVGDAVPLPLLREAEDRERALREPMALRVERRRREGRVVDGHGDLHLQHVWFESDGAEPLLVDCLEFSERLRRIDAASEVAFTAMDLAYRERGDLAERFLRIYARERDDYDLYGVVDWFACYRALVRAKVAAIAAREPEIEARQRAGALQSARRHLALASRLLEPRAPGRLVLVSGVVGTGKSTAATILAEASEAVVVASDRVRKHLAGLDPGERGSPGWRRGIYTEEHTERTYSALLERARSVLAAGRSCILDATFAARRHRDAARALARELGTSARLIELRCAADVTLQRLARREAAGSDASDAGPGHHAASVGSFEPTDEWPEASHVVVYSDVEAWSEELRERAADLLHRDGATLAGARG